MKRGRSSVYTISLGAVLSALALALLFLASVLPSGWVGVTAVAGLCVGTALSTLGLSGAVLCYIVSAALGLLLVPLKQAAVLYLLFFGCYPIIKFAAERLKHRGAEWGVKLVCANVLLALALVCFQFLLQVDLAQWIGLALSAPVVIGLWIAGNAVFAAYDLAFSQIMALIQRRVAPLLRRRFQR